MREDWQPVQSLYVRQMLGMELMLLLFLGSEVGARCDKKNRVSMRFSITVGPTKHSSDRGRPLEHM